MKQKVIFRVDANPEIGLGHLTRCLALAEMIIEDFECVFAIFLPKLEVVEQIRSIKSSVMFLSDEFIDVFTSLLTGNEIVILDGYNFTESDQKKIKEKNCKLVFIDDLNAQHFFADVVINHNLTANAAKYSKEENTQVYTGSEYILLRKDFLTKIARIHNKKNEFSKVLICLGGADKDNLSLKLCTMLSDYIKIEKINVLVGSAYPFDENELITINAKINVHRNLSAEKIVKLMEETDFAIVSASGIAYECASVNLPFIVGYYLRHQCLFYEALIKQKNIIGLGDFKNLNSERLYNLILELQTDYQPNCNSFIDKKQKERYLQIFNSLLIN